MACFVAIINDKIQHTTSTFGKSCYKKRNLQYIYYTNKSYMTIML